MNLRRTLAIVCLGSVIGLAAGLTGCGSYSTPESTVRNSIKAFNNRDLNSFLKTIDPAKESLVRFGIGQFYDQTGVSLQALADLLPGVIQILGNPLPDAWQLDAVKIKNPKREDDLAWLTVSGNLITRVRDMKSQEAKTMRFALCKYHSLGWRIVDFQLQ
jgi:hypothetical protein